jgi:hypothetical protein
LAPLVVFSTLTDISKHILNLLSKEELAFVPDLGGFISKSVPARIEGATRVFYPPSKELAFNDRLQSSDNKLIELICVAENVDLEQASEMVKGFVNHIKANLQTTAKYDLVGIGTFNLSEEGSVLFQAKLSPDSDPDNFGLPTLLLKHQEQHSRNSLLTKPKDRKAMSTLDLQPVPDPNQQGDFVPDPIDEESEHKDKKQGKSLTWLYIATPLVLLGIFGMFLGGTEDGRKMLASMHVIETSSTEDSSQTEITATEETIPEESTAPTEEATASESFDNASSAEETIKKTENDVWAEAPQKSHQENIATSEDVETATANIINGKSGRCFVIVGGFASKKNAIKLREKLVSDGMESKVIAPKFDGDIYRVSLGDYSDRPEASQKIEEFKANYGESLWVMIY